tara:strand:+ start:2373 stop:3533 length:1161 start_codon:yes stop_codon:yes gene_type:complete
LAKLSKIYHTFNLFGKRIFLFFLLLVGVNNFSFSQSAEKQIRTIVIDAGHGGKDPGTMGTKRYKIYEKDIALEVSLILGRYIEKKFPEIKVVYTRKKDVFLELWERTELANKNDADLFISIHCDGFKNSDVSGASVFVMGMSKLKANMDVAMRENSVMYLEDNFKEKYDGFDPKSAESYIVFSLMQNTYLEQSISFAQQLDIQFVERVYRKSRGVKQAPFYVISRVNMPSVLIELGFLTNPDEEDFLHSENGQIYMASAIFRAFKEYKETVDGLLVIDTDDSNEDFKEIEILENKDLKEELNIVFKIQLGTYLKSMKNSSVFDGMNVEEDLTNGTYRYFLSLGNDKKEADKLKLKHRSGKFAGAFIVAFYNEKQISVKEALDLLNK